MTNWLKVLFYKLIFTILCFTSFTYILYNQFSTFDNESSPGAPSVEKETMLDLLKDSVLVWRLLNLCSTWLIIILGYYGLSLSSVSLSGDPYLNFFLVSLVEIPGKICIRV
jgi:hypothetical protein